jgi:hypothetical protein
MGLGFGVCYSVFRLDAVRLGVGFDCTGLTHFKMKNPYGAGLSRLWATREKSRKKPAPTTVWGSTA